MDQQQHDDHHFY